MEADTKTCFDPFIQTAEGVCRNDDISKQTMGKLNDLRVVFGSPAAFLGDPSCPPTAAAPIMMGLASSAFSATMNGTTTPLGTRGGYATMDWGCDIFELCHPLTIGKMRLIMNDATINGIPFTNTVIELKQPVAVDPNGVVPRVLARSMNLLVTTTTPLGTTRFVASPTSDLTVGMTGNTALQVSGSFSGAVPGSNHTVTPVTINVNLNTNTTSSGAQCAGLTRFQQLTGFENVNDWTTDAGSLSPNPTLHTQGCFGLSVNGSNFRNVSSGRFATPISGGKAKLLLDVYVPPNQPNPFFFGAVQTLMSCPAAGINNVFLGQVDLTGKPVGVFSTLSYNVPANVQAALAGNTSDCSFLIGVNTNATPTPPVLDNLRFSF